MTGPARENHPNRDRLERFMRGELSREETRAVVRHLLSECPQCLMVTRKLWHLCALPPYQKALKEEANASLASSSRGLLEADGH